MTEVDSSTGKKYLKAICLFSLFRYFFNSGSDLSSRLRRATTLVTFLINTYFDLSLGLLQFTSWWKSMKIGNSSNMLNAHYFINECVLCCTPAWLACEVRSNFAAS